MTQHKKAKLTMESIKVWSIETHRLNGRLRAHILDKLIASVQNNKVDMDKLREMGYIVKCDGQ